MDTRSLAAQISRTADDPGGAGPDSPSGSGLSPQAHGPRESRPGTERSARVLPDPAICRAEALGITDYAACLVEHPVRCPHAVGFGYGFFCRHPHRDKIIAGTAMRGQERRGR